MILNRIQDEILVLQSLNLPYLQDEELSVYLELLKMHAGLYESLASQVKDLQPPDPDKLALKKGKPILEISAQAFSDDQLLQHLADVGKVLFGFEDTSEKLLGFCREKLKEAGLTPMIFVRGAILGYRTVAMDKLMKNIGMEPDSLRLWGTETVRPWFWKIAELVTFPASLNTWPYGYCPVCANRPEMAYMAKGLGTRYLVCGLCGFQWPSHPIKCVYCNNIEQGTLRHLFTEDKNPYRLNVCDICKGYLRTVDLNKWLYPREFLPRVESLVMLYLDMLADREGFTSSPNIH